MALYSGVSPFGISAFVDVPVDQVEAMYDRLIELDIIEVERERTAVELTAQGDKLIRKLTGQ